MNFEQYKKAKLTNLHKTSSLLSFSTHAINNAVAIIIGQTSISKLMHQKGQLTDEKITHLFNKLEVGTEKLVENIDMLKNFYKIVSENRVQEVVFLPEVINSIVHFNKIWLEKKSIEITSDVKSNSSLGSNTVDLYLFLDYIIEYIGQLDTLRSIELVARENTITIKYSKIEQLALAQEEIFIRFKEELQCSISQTPDSIAIILE